MLFRDVRDDISIFLQPKHLKVAHPHQSICRVFPRLEPCVDAQQRERSTRGSHLLGSRAL
jgi:hypothetical protein